MQHSKVEVQICCNQLQLISCISNATKNSMEFSAETLTQLTMDRSVPRRECVPNSKQTTKNAAANLNGVEGEGGGG